MTDSTLIKSGIVDVVYGLSFVEDNIQIVPLILPWMSTGGFTIRMLLEKCVCQRRFAKAKKKRQKIFKSFCPFPFVLRFSVGSSIFQYEATFFFIGTLIFERDALQ